MKSLDIVTCKLAFKQRMHLLLPVVRNICFQECFNTRVHRLVCPWARTRLGKNTGSFRIWYDDARLEGLDRL